MLLLDQDMLVSGIGNWVADDILYDACIHPERTFENLSNSKDSIRDLGTSVYRILSVATAEDVNADAGKFPVHWLFNVRWDAAKQSSNDKTIDPNRPNLQVIEVGGRTTLVDPKKQLLNDAKSTVRRNVSNQTAQKHVSKNPKNKHVKKESSSASLSDGEKKETYKNSRLPFAKSTYPIRKPTAKCAANKPVMKKSIKAPVNRLPLSIAKTVMRKDENMKTTIGAPTVSTHKLKTVPSKVRGVMRTVVSKTKSISTKSISKPLVKKTLPMKKI